MKTAAVCGGGRRTRSTAATSPAPDDSSTLRRRRARPGSERGAATAELVVAMPLLLLLLGLIIQGAVWFHAAHVAQAAADRALDTARGYQASAAAGQDQGLASVAALGPNILLDPQVTVTRTATQVTVRITARTPSVVPGVSLPVTVVRTAPVEVFVPMSRGFTISDGPIAAN